MHTNKKYKGRSPLIRPGGKAAQEPIKKDQVTRRDGSMGPARGPELSGLRSVT